MQMQKQVVEAERQLATPAHAKVKSLRPLCPRPLQNEREQVVKAKRQLAASAIYQVVGAIMPFDLWGAEYMR